MLHWPRVIGSAPKRTNIYIYIYQIPDRIIKTVRAVIKFLKIAQKSLLAISRNWRTNIESKTEPNRFRTLREKHNSTATQKTEPPRKNIINFWKQLTGTLSGYFAMMFFDSFNRSSAYQNKKKLASEAHFVSRKTKKKQKNPERKDKPVENWSLKDLTTIPITIDRSFRRVIPTESVVFFVWLQRRAEDVFNLVGLLLILSERRNGKKTERYQRDALYIDRKRRRHAVTLPHMASQYSFLLSTFLD